MQFVLIPQNNAATIKSWEKDFEDVLAWIESLEPPKYPWPIDATFAARGRAIFEKRCSSCHGTYGPEGKYPEKTVDIDVVGTDRRRLDGMPVEHRRFFAHGWFSEDGARRVVEQPVGYVAPPLDGLWASAPYFHNGSAPTLAHVLTPESRPIVWLRTEDGYDQRRVGLEAAELSEAPSTAVDQKRRYFDTRLPGKSAAGHDFATGLSAEEKASLLEYLKTL
jgi:hypothetical protein